MKKRHSIVLGIAAIGLAAAVMLTGCPDESSDSTVDLLDLSGKVTAPVKGAEPVTAFTETQYTGTVAWKTGADTDHTGAFAAETVYKAEITLTAKSGWTFEGVKKDSFRHSGATVSNGADSGTVTVTFPATALGTSAPVLTLTSGNGTLTYMITPSVPAADSYDVYWIAGKDKTAAEIKGGTKITGAVSGGTITGLTNYTVYSAVVSANKAGYTSMDSGPVRELTGIAMVSIRGGTFTMGSPNTEADRGGDEIQHSVTLRAFKMGKYEVTQAQWEAVMGNNPSNFTGDDQRPAEQVSWYDAVAFCNKLSIMAGLEPVYRVSGVTDWAHLAYASIPTATDADWDAAVMDKTKNGYRLPTEAEWEYACRAGTSTPFSTGNNITTDQANYNGNYPYNNNVAGTYRQTTTSVGTFTANSWGLYDMHGNVFEWCWDWYDGYSAGAQTDPKGAVSGAIRVRRGGSWFIFGQYLRSAYRSIVFPSDRLNRLGFRLVRPRF